MGAPCIFNRWFAKPCVAKAIVVALMRLVPGPILPANRPSEGQVGVKRVDQRLTGVVVLVARVQPSAHRALRVFVVGLGSRPALWP